MKLSSSTASVPAFVTDEFTAPAAASPTAFVLAIATSTSPVTLSGAGLTGGTGAGALSPARNVTVTVGGLGAGITNGSAVVLTGTDPTGAVQTETVTLTVVGSPGIFLGLKLFASLTSVAIPAQAAATATIAVGFGVLLGLSQKVRSRAGRLAVLQEVSGAVALTTGTVANPASCPVASYSPVAAANGVLNYAVTYEHA